MGTDFTSRERERAVYADEPAIEDRVPSDHATTEGSIVAGAVAGGLLGAVGAGVIGSIVGAVAGAAVGAGAERVMHSALHYPGSRGQDIYNDGIGHNGNHPPGMELPTDQQANEFVDTSSQNEPGDQREPPVGPDTTRERHT